jgi:hypothetical protein
MTENQPNIEGLKIVTDLQQSEADLNWKRNNIFLICSSILLVALSQFNLAILRFLIAALGFALNFAWLLIQYRSSKYILHWKGLAQTLREQDRNMPDIYPKNLPGIEVRKIALCLPLPFMIIWAIIMIINI